MRTFVLFCLVLVSSVSVLVDVAVGYNYHETVGIPTAKKIIAYEKELLKNQSPHERIIGGKLLDDIKPYPYFAGLLITLTDKRMSICGASLVSANKLVTAAHCWYDGRNQASSIEVVLGSHLILSGGTRITTKQVIVHPQFDYRKLTDDAAVMTLPRDVEYNERIQPISLPSSDKLSLTFEDVIAVAVGYGKTRYGQNGVAKQVSAVNLTVISNKVCEKTFGSYAGPGIICTSGAGKVGTCSGDSGGPLATIMDSPSILIGIKSFGARICDQGKPTAFTRVTTVIDFINQHL